MSQLGIAAYEAMHGVGGWGEIGPAGRAAWDRVGEAVRAAAEAEIRASERARCARVARLAIESCREDGETDMRIARDRVDDAIMIGDKP